MTCEEIAAQVSELTANFDALTADLNSQTADVNLAYSNAVGGDTFGGIRPPVPITTMGISARINYLSTLFMPPTALITAYENVKALSMTRDGTAATLQQTVDMLGGFKQQAIDQGC